MEENQELRQLQNAVEIVGTLKSKDLEVKVSRAGNPYMAGSLTVMSKINDVINEQVVKVFIMQSSKLFKGIETVMNEYKSIEEVNSSHEADKIRVSGELALEEYYNRDGNLVQYNSVKGVFFSRVDETVEDKSIATIETVVTKFEDEKDLDGLPTGVKKVEGFTVAWGNEVVLLKNAIVNEDLANTMQDLYSPGSTGRLTFQLNNYVEVDKQEEEPEASSNHGFGSTQAVESNVAKKYVNNLQIIGGDVPYLDSKEYTQSEIDLVHQVRELKLQNLQAPAPETPQTKPTGFGGNQPSPTSTISSSDMPDF